MLRPGSELRRVPGPKEPSPPAQGRHLALPRRVGLALPTPELMLALALVQGGTAAVAVDVGVVGGVVGGEVGPGCLRSRRPCSANCRATRCSDVT